VPTDPCDDARDLPAGEAFEGEYPDKDIRDTGTGGAVEGFYSQAESEDEDFEEVRVKSSLSP